MQIIQLGLTDVLFHHRHATHVASQALKRINHATIVGAIEARLDDNVARQTEKADQALEVFHITFGQGVVRLRNAGILAQGTKHMHVCITSANGYREARTTIGL
ncbi:hypothetical protein D9M71_755640 [compost metagenome]